MEVNQDTFINIDNNVITNALLSSSKKMVINLMQEVNKAQFTLHEYIYDTVNKRSSLKKIKSFKVEFAVKRVSYVYNFDLNKNYAISYQEELSPVFLDPELGGILDTQYDISNEEGLGLDYEGGSATLKFWSPPATIAKLILFDKNQKELTAHSPLFFIKLKNGVFELSLSAKEISEETIEGLYYQYEIYAYGKVKRALCPYAKSMASFDPDKDMVGKAAIIRNPKSLKKFSNKAILDTPTSMIAYETHVRDFTIQPGVTEKEIAGTFSGFSEKVDYLHELGITHVQLLPVNKSHTQVDENKSYTGKDSAESNYNWGYDVLNYFTPEGRYSVAPQNPQKRVDELQNLSSSLHTAGIGLIFDVVFNHTYSDATFENIAPGCYYRLDNKLKISQRTGAGSSLESRRKTVRKFILDCLEYYVTVYGADGFRFDLMGFHDYETMEQIRTKIGKAYNSEDHEDLILQGEAWDFTDIYDGTAYTKSNIFSKSLNISVFNDTFRDSACGRDEENGFVQGNWEKASSLASGIAGALQSFDQEELPFLQSRFYRNYALFAQNPAENLNFLSIHDGLTLWDKINLTQKDETGKERLRTAKLAAAILFVSQGKIIWHGGDEMLRSKPTANNEKDPDRTFTSELADIENETLFFHENSYRANDYTNMFRWNKFEDESAQLTKKMFNYVKGLIELRKEIPAFRYNSRENLEKGLRFLHPQPNNKNNKQASLGINTFQNPKLTEFHINFINGIPNETYYLVGEVHKSNPNPIVNSYQIHFDENGNAKLTFNRAQIENFDHNKWIKSNNLAIKVVKTPAEWNNFPGAYSLNGVNLISPLMIDSNYEATIDLGKKDYWDILPPKEYNYNQIIFTLDNTLESAVSEQTSKQGYDSFLVIINSDNLPFQFLSPFSIDKYKGKVIADDLTINTNGLANYSINDDLISVARKSILIIGYNPVQ